MQILAIVNIQDKVINNFSRLDITTFEKYIDQPCCDICHTNHKRTKLFVFQEGDKIFAAGKTCFVKMYPEIKFGDLIKQAKQNQKAIAKNSLVVRDLIAAGCVYIEQKGFQPRYSSTDFGCNWDEYIKNAYEDKQYIELAEKIIKFYKNIDTTNDFMFNCKNICKLEYCSDKVVGFFPAMVNCYLKTIERENIKRQICDQTEFYGEIGQKVVDKIKATVIGIREVEGESFSYYDKGIRNQVFLKDNQKHIFCSWVIPNRKNDKNKYVYAHVGDEVIIERFTIKNHFESTFGKVTSIIRPKFELPM